MAGWYFYHLGLHFFFSFSFFCSRLSAKQISGQRNYLSSQTRHDWTSKGKKRWERNCRGKKKIRVGSNDCAEISQVRTEMYI